MWGLCRVLMVVNPPVFGGLIWWLWWRGHPADQALGFWVGLALGIVGALVAFVAGSLATLGVGMSGAARENGVRKVLAPLQVIGVQLVAVGAVGLVVIWFYSMFRK